MVDGFRKRLTEVRKLLNTLPGIGTHRRLEIVSFVGCFALGILIPWIGMQFQGAPAPSSPLAEARLLAAETFAAGRLSNPAVPGAFFLQTYLTLQEPAYAAATPAGPSFLLAIGLMLGDPLYGIWLTSGLFSLAVAWMIRGYASLRWSIIGGLLVTVWFGALSFWSQSYEGAAATAIGIALAWGAARRYWTRQSAANALILSLGLGWTFLCDPVAAAFSLGVPLFLWAKKWWGGRQISHLLTLLAGLAAFAFLQVSLNKASTGNAFTTASGLYRERYNNAPRFLWEFPSPPRTLDFLRMEQYDGAIHMPASLLTPPAARTWVDRIADALRFYVCPPAMIIIIGALWSGLTIWGRWILLGGIGTLASTVLILPFSLADAAGLAILGPLLAVWAMRQIWTQKERAGKNYWRLSGTLLIMLIVCAYIQGLGMEPDDAVNLHAKYQKELTEHLAKNEQGRHLVMVQYDLNVPPRVEYVYNTARPESQDVVWARANDRADPSALFSHFADRKTWMLRVKLKGAPELRPFNWVASTENKQVRAQ